jgi:hypothetical protein
MADNLSLHMSQQQAARSITKDLRSQPIAKLEARIANLRKSGLNAAASNLAKELAALKRSDG